MSSAALKAHVRLLESDLPRRTHEQREPDYGYRPQGRPGRRKPVEAIALAERIDELVAQGHCNVEIAAQLGVTPMTVGRHRRGLIKATAKR